MASWRGSSSTALVLLSWAVRSAGLRTLDPLPLDPWTFNADEKPPDYLQWTHATNPTDGCGLQAAREEGQGLCPDFAKWHFAPPGSSSWLRFSGPTLCKKLTAGARDPKLARILFVGDSMQHHLSQNMVHLLGPGIEHLRRDWHANDPRLHKKDFLSYFVNGTSKNDAYITCNGTAFVRQQGSQNLYKDYTNFKFEEHTDWLHSFDVIFLQLAWQGGSAYLEEVTSFWANVTLPHQKLFARTSTIGHTKTGVSYQHTWDGDILPMLAQRPHHDPFRTAEELTGYFHQVDTHTSWQTMQGAQERAKKVFEAHKIDVIDVFLLAAMMWDRHRDPLHYCNPGPMVVWAEVVFNYLMRGHLRDYNNWVSAFAQEVQRVGGLTNVNGEHLANKVTGLSRDQDDM